jgi:coenzyme F420-reducing hydrogenase gamma subunit
VKKLAVWKFASCDGCQLSLLDLEDEILQLADAVDIAFFPEASSAMHPGPYDLSLVEGSITTQADEKRILEVRRESKFLVTIGACATAGGIQALRNFSCINEYKAMVYASPEYVDTLAESHAISSRVAVDFELRGCPIDKHQLLEVISSFLLAKKPNIPNESVCCECKRQDLVCVLVAEGKACLGPITHAGCGALCPRYSRACYGCFGPKENAQTEPLSQAFLELGETRQSLVHILRNFNAAAPAFAAESRRHERL